MLDLIPAPLQGILGTLVLEYTAFWCYVIVAVIVDRRRRASK